MHVMLHRLLLWMRLLVLWGYFWGLWVPPMPFLPIL